jgi:hypothetical protein
LEIDRLVPFLLVESHQRANLDIAILFSPSERSGNYVFEDKKIPPAQRTRFVSYALGTYRVFIEIVVI